MARSEWRRGRSFSERVTCHRRATLHQCRSRQRARRGAVHLVGDELGQVGKERLQPRIALKGLKGGAKNMRRALKDRSCHMS
jgi:hypothetical protein